MRGVAAPLAHVFAALLVPVIAGTAWLCLASFFLNQTMPMPIGQQARFVKPLIESSDIILTDLEDEQWRMFLVFANMDEFLIHRPCFESTPTNQWISRLQAFSCNFDNLAYQLSLTDEERQQTRSNFAPREVSLLVAHQTGATNDPVPMLRSAFPAAKVREYRDEKDPVAFTSLTVTMEDLRALRP